MKTWLFWDWWQIERQNNVEIRQGRPRWVPEATYADPTLGYLGYWPRVWREHGGFRMVYVGSGFPLTVFCAESPDGVRWTPSHHPEVKPAGEKFASNHVFTVENANGGPIFRHETDSKYPRFIMVLSNRGGPRAAPAALDANPVFHELVNSPGAKPYDGQNRVAVSQDGIHWQLAPNRTGLNLPGWFPEPAFSVFFNDQAKDYTLITRHGWGDRRLALATSQEGLAWSAPAHLFQPDSQDSPQTQFYGMPVHKYEGWYVGFLWMAHFANAQRLERWNQVEGSVDSQLAYSPDGRTFQRFLREPFMPLHEPGEPGSAVLYPTSLVDAGDRLLIYSGSSSQLHHQRTGKQFQRQQADLPFKILLHTLRKDGFSYLASAGSWATIQTKPMILKEPRLEMNLLGPYGEGVFQLTDAASKPLPGFTFDACKGFSGGDSLAFPLVWKSRLESLVGVPVRLEVKFRNVRIHALRGDFHFADALDIARASHGQPLEVGPFDF